MKNLLIVCSLTLAFAVPMSVSANNTQYGNVVGNHVQCILPDGTSVFVPQLYCDINKGKKQY
ncbi:hypothetical protein EJ063_10425 [Vibrio aquaticus]|uniref:Uncharacterized protein n=1 Tax=Vibrio aquaticus TaxID=2496559 RepID=A0A432CZ75_9VIBR|nr:hypothetical protein [Vibrio aquaticus]RTZ16179.1 hypothetical protein EJ063_10425 [Vibrio aquaticus]